MNFNLFQSRLRESCGCTRFFGLFNRFDLCNFGHFFVGDETLIRREIDEMWQLDQIFAVVISFGCKFFFLLVNGKARKNNYLSWAVFKRITIRLSLLFSERGKKVETNFVTVTSGRKINCLKLKNFFGAPKSFQKFINNLDCFSSKIGLGLRAQTRAPTDSKHEWWLTQKQEYQKMTSWGRGSPNCYVRGGDHFIGQVN